MIYLMWKVLLKCNDIITMIENRREFTNEAMAVNDGSSDDDCMNTEDGSDQ